MDISPFNHLMYRARIWPCLPATDRPQAILEGLLFNQHIKIFSLLQYKFLPGHGKPFTREKLAMSLEKRKRTSYGMG